MDLPTSARGIPRHGPPIDPHSESHNPTDGTDPVLGEIRYLGTASTTGVFSDNSGTFADVTSLSLTVRSRGGDLLIFFRGRVDVSDAQPSAGYQVRADIDGTALRVNTHEVNTGIISGTPAILVFQSSASQGPGTDAFLPLGGANVTTLTTDANAEGTAIMPYAGTVSLMYVVAANTLTTASATITARKNGSDQTLVTTLAGGADTGNDTTHSFSVVAGDYVSVRCTAAAGGAGTIVPVTVGVQVAASAAGSDTVDFANSGTEVWLSAQKPGLHTVKIQAKSVGASTAFTVDENADLIVFELLPLRRG